MNEFNDFFKLIAEGKKDYKENDPIGIHLEKVKEHAKNDLSSLFSQLSQISSKKESIKDIDLGIVITEEELVVEDTIEEIVAPIIEEASNIEAYTEAFSSSIFQQPEVAVIEPNIKAVQDKLKFLEQWVSKIAIAGAGSGEVNLRWLDDVYRPSIYDGRFLRYNDILKKFEFAEVNPHDIVYTTVLITNPTYVINDSDYYVGVDYIGTVTITLPDNPSSGRMLIIKDESGHASTNPITVLGTVDNDTGGFIIQLDNGGIQMIYRNGWRIV